MKLSFPRVVSAVAGGVIGLVALAAGCEPKNDVKPGAPVLNSMVISEPSGTKTEINAMTADCAAGITEGGNCDPDSTPVCRLMAVTYCHCDKKPDGDMSILPEDPTTNGSATCSYDPMSSVLAVFDRIIDPAPFDVGDSGASPTGLADVTPASTLAFDYSPNGIPMGLLFSPAVFGDPLGPYITITGLPDNAAVTLTLSKTKILAKDGKTPFVGMGLIQDGILTFKTNALPVPDGGTD